MSTKNVDNVKSFEGMIRNANQVLEQALEPKVNGIPRTLFEVSVGLVIVEVGFKLTGNVGAGILFKKQPKKNGSTKIYSKWSAPSAIGLTGLGYYGAKDTIIVFIMDDSTLESICTNHGYKLRKQSAITLGPLGRSYQIDTEELSKGGTVDSTICVAFSKGEFIGINNVKGAVLGVRDKVNATFYQAPNISVNEIVDVVPRDEILKRVVDEKVQHYLLNDVYNKLKQVEDKRIERSLTQVAIQFQNTAEVTKKANDDYMRYQNKTGSRSTKLLLQL